MATRVVTLVPDGTVSNAWTVGGAASAHAALADESDSTYVESSTNGQLCEVNLSSAALQPGEYVTGVRIKARAQTHTDQSLGVAVTTAAQENLGGYDAFFGSMQLLNHAGSVGDVASLTFPGAGNPFAASAADRGKLDQTKIDGLRVRLVLWEVVPQASATRVSRLRVELDISTALPRVRRQGSRLALAGAGEARLWGVNFRESLLHDNLSDPTRPAPTIGQLRDEITKHAAKGLNFLRLHVETTKIKTAAGNAGWVASELSKLVELLQHCNDAGVYVELCLNAAYSSNQSWYESLTEAQRWDERRIVARKLAGMFNEHPAVAFWCLLNEGLAPTSAQSWWRLGDAGGTGTDLFVEWLVKDPAGRSAAELWSDWLADILSAADGVRLSGIGPDALVTCGIPTPDARDVLTAMETNGAMGLDLVAPHIYPRRSSAFQAEYARRAAQFGLPVVVNEFYWDVVTNAGYIPEVDGVYVAGHDFSGFAGHSDGRTSTDYGVGLTITEALQREMMRWFEHRSHHFRRRRITRVGDRRANPHIGYRT